VKKLLRIVNDTNVWLSALYFSGKPAQIVNLIEQKQIVSVTSGFILDETLMTLTTKFDTPSVTANGTVAYIASISEMVEIKGRDFNLRDPKDNSVLETAVIGKCDYLVTGDRDLLSLKKYQNLQIVNPNNFLLNYK